MLIVGEVGGEDELLIHVISGTAGTAWELKLVVVVEMFVGHVVGQSVSYDGLEGTEWTVQSVSQSVRAHTAFYLGGVATELTAVDHPGLPRLFLLPTLHGRRWWKEDLGVYWSFWSYVHQNLHTEL